MLGQLQRVAHELDGKIRIAALASTAATPGKQRRVEHDDSAAVEAEVERLRTLVETVLAQPVVAELESSLSSAVLRCDWRQRLQMTKAASVACADWLSAVRSRIARSFLPTAPPMDRPILSHVSSAFESNESWIPKQVPIVLSPPLPMQDELFIEVERVLSELRAELQQGPCELRQDASVHHVLAAEMNIATEPSVRAPRECADEQSDALKWASRRQASLNILVDDYLLALCVPVDDGPCGNATDVEHVPASQQPATTVSTPAIADAAPHPIQGSGDTPENSTSPAERPNFMQLLQVVTRLSNSQLEPTAVLRVVIESVPLCFGQPVDCALFTAQPGAAPATHQHADGSDDLTLTVLDDSGAVVDQTAIRYLAAPLPVQIALEDGSKWETVLHESPDVEALQQGETAEPRAVPVTSTSFVPVFGASARPAAVIQARPKQGLLKPDERNSLAMLATSAGHALQRCSEQVASKALAERALREARLLEVKRAQLEATLQQKQALIDQLIEPQFQLHTTLPSTVAGLKELAESARRLTAAAMVTIFGAPISFTVERPDLVPLHNDFEPLILALQQQRESEQRLAFDRGCSPLIPIGKGRQVDFLASSASAANAPPMAPVPQLPHPGFAREAVLSKEAVNCADVTNGPSGCFDRTEESAAGFHSTCVLVLPVYHAGEVLGAIQLTNKVVAVGSAAGGEDLPERPPENLTSSQLFVASPEPSNYSMLGSGTAASGTDGAAHEGGGTAQGGALCKNDDAVVGFTEQDVLAMRCLQSNLTLLLLQARQERLAIVPASAPARSGQDGVGRLRATARHPGVSQVEPERPKDTARRPQQPQQPLRSLTNVPAVLSTVIEISTELGSAKTLRELLGTALHAANRLTSAEHASIFLIGEDDGTMLNVAFARDELGRLVESELELHRFPEVGPGVASHVRTSGETLVVPFTAEEPRFDPTIDRAPGYLVTSILCTPVRGANGYSIGALQLCNKVSDHRQQGNEASGHLLTDDTTACAFDAADERVVGMLCSILGPALERQLLFDRSAV